MSMHPLHHPLFVKFIVYFNGNQDYFECHEVLEEYWKSLPDGGKAHPLTAYILLATGLYHWRRGNGEGALKTLRKAEDKFQSMPNEYPVYAQEIDYTRLMEDVQQSIGRLEQELEFEPFPLQVTDRLQKLADDIEPSMELLPAQSDAVVYKHMLRDRSDILSQREEKKKGRR
ncbi:DUF309 domain-containing protein [Sporosarcina sp. 179-K 3D1 HS]|uniref:DUF309 domain-containing protein n=1 Tax=Sporosarcina sp. 179-K 3D1 HS TaxID=3232169 RepID=UPI0039A32E56